MSYSTDFEKELEKLLKLKKKEEKTGVKKPSVNLRIVGREYDLLGIDHKRAIKDDEDISSVRENSDPELVGEYTSTLEELSNLEQIIEEEEKNDKYYVPEGAKARVGSFASDDDIAPVDPKFQLTANSVASKILNGKTSMDEYDSGTKNPYVDSRTTNAYSQTLKNKSDAIAATYREIADLEKKLGYTDADGDQMPILMQIFASDGNGNQITDLIDDFTGTETERSALRQQLKAAQKRLKELEGKEDNNDSWLKSGAFEDGYQFGDFIRTGYATGVETIEGLAKGAVKPFEGVSDLILHGASQAAGAVGADEAAEYLKESANRNVVDELADMAVSDTVRENSLYGDKGKAVPEAVGQVFGLSKFAKALEAAGLTAKAISALTSGTMFASSTGSGISEAYNHEAEVKTYVQNGIKELDKMLANGEITKEVYDKAKAEFDDLLESNKVSDAEAWSYGALKGTIDAGSEMIFGGLGKTVNALGYNRGISSLDDAFAKKLSNKISSAFTNEYLKRVAGNSVEYTVKALAEGSEEWIAGLCTAAAKKLTYMSDEELEQLVEDENLLDQFVIGTIASGFAQGGDLVSSIKTDTDFITGLTQNEQSVVDKEVENRIAEEEKESGKKLTNQRKNQIQEAVMKDLDKGYISTDTIEDVLGGDSYKAYQDTVKSEDALKKEYDELGDLKESELTVKQRKRLNELEKQIEALEKTSERDFLQRKYKDEVYEIVKGSRLSESYNERARRGQAFEADLSKYDEKQRVTIQKAIDSGILNNTNRTHEFVDMVAKIAADKGVSFDFANNEKIKETGFALEGKTVNGYVTQDGVTVNIQSAKSLNTVVGHEITHVLEGTELYTELQSAIVAYAKTKGDYQGRYDELVKLYENVEGADINAELTAELVGDYLFTDSDFIGSLSTEHRNVFQKIFDEIKYLCKTVTAGSKEARQLEKVKKAFEDAFRAETVFNDKSKNFSLSSNKAKKLRADIERLGSQNIVLNADGKKIRVLTDEFTVQKNIYSKKGRSDNEVNARMKAIPYFESIIKNSVYESTDTQINVSNDAKKGVIAMHHFKSKYNGYEVDILIRDKGKKQYLYEIKFINNKKSSQQSMTDNSASPAPNGDVENINIVSQNQKKSTQNTKNSLSFEGEDLAPVRGDIYGKDIALEGISVQEDLAPVATDLNGSLMDEDAASIGDYNAYGGDVTLDGAIPDDYAPIAETPNSQTSVDSESGNVNRVDTEDATALSTESEAHNNANRQYEIASDSKIEEDNIASGKDAITTLISQARSSNDPQALTVKGAMYRTDIGSIDFVWGFPGKGQNLKKGYGISHIIAKRDLENGSGERTLDALINVIAKATEAEVQKNTNNPGNDRIRLYYDGYTAVLSQKPQGNSWLLTGWENKKETASYAYGEGYDSSAATATMPILTRHDRGNDTVSNNIIAPIDNVVNTLDETTTIEDLAPVAADLNGSLVDEDIAPVAETATAKKAIENEAPASDKPIQTVKERLEAKLQNLNDELEHNRALQKDAEASFHRRLEKLQAEYDGKKNKDTKGANDLLRRIENLKRLQKDVDTDYQKRISDLETRRTKVSEELRRGESSSEQAAMRRELHHSIIETVKAKFAENGLDLDEVLKRAKDLSTFATVDNTPQRVMEKSLGYKAGQTLADLTVNRVAQNETDGIRWLNSFTDRRNGLLKQISKQYGIKPGSKESAAAQMYAEGFFVDKNNDIIAYGDNELAADFPNAQVQANIKGLAKDPRIRKIYDETLAMINESRVRNAYHEIQRLDNYFLHFRAMEDTFSRLGLPFRPSDIKAADLPTDLNGVTADLKPGQPYFASAKHREGKRTSFDLLGGLERYLSSAKNQIFHIDDIQTLRALRNYVADTYGQANGLEGLDALTEEEAQERIAQVYGSHLSTFAKFLNEEANVIAGKTALIDRGLEGIIGRRGIKFLATVNGQVGSNMVGFNASSSLTNILPAVQAFAKTNKTAFAKGFAQTVANKVSGMFGRSIDTFTEDSPVVVRRKGEDRFYRTPYQKIGDLGYTLMGAVDNISTEIIARAKYNELTSKGMNAEQAHIETDKWVSRLMGDRSLGQQPQLYNSKMLGFLTKFQLEVRNQLDSQFYDTIQEANASTEEIENGLLRNAKKAAKIGSTFLQLAVAQHLFGQAFEAVAGYNPSFDIIEVLIKAFGFDDDEDDEDTVLDNIEQGFLALLEDLPYTSTLTGGRIPISSALPIEELVTGKDQYGNEKPRLETLGEALPYYIMPGGYGQFKKSYQGIRMFDNDLPVSGSYTDSGNLRFPVEDTWENQLQALLFGQYANENAKDYFDNDRSPLKEKQIQEFIDSGISIQEYWEYREGLSGLETLAEKADYINSLDLPIETKNLLLNNLSARKNPIDLSDMEGYDNFQEYDFATQNPAKYAELQESGITVAEYTGTDAKTRDEAEYAATYPKKYAFFKENDISFEGYVNGDDETQAAYTWAFNNRGKYLLFKDITSDVIECQQYVGQLADIKADKDENGKTISGSRKENVIDHINDLDVDYGLKIILFKSEYPSDHTYNHDIVDYLNGRDDISYREMETILKELGFKVLSDGTVRWD